MKTFIKKVFVTVTTIVLFLSLVPAMAQYTKTVLHTGGLYTALTKDATGNVYVTKASSPGVYHVAKYIGGTGTPTIIYSGLTSEPQDFPWGLAVAPNGDVYISTDFTSNGGAIIRLNAATSYSATTVQTGRYFTGLTFDAAGTLYALEYNSTNSDYAVCKYAAPATTNSAKTMLYHGLPSNQGVGYPTGIAISPAGDIFVTKPYTVAVVSGVPNYTGGILKLNAPSYGTTTSIATGTYATALVLDEFGNLYAAETSGTNAYSVNKYTGATGTPTAYYTNLHAADPFYPYGVTFIGTTGYIADGDNGSGGELIKLSPSDITPPAIPTGLAVAAGTGQNTLTWNANSDVDFLGYKIYGGTSATPNTLIASIPKGTTTYLNTGLTNGTTYYYRISSEDNNFNESAKSADVTGKPLPPATAPTATTGGNTPSYVTAALAGTVNDNNATTAVSFDYGLTTAYGSSVSGTPASIVAGTGSTSVTGSLTGLTAGTVYHYRVKAVNSVNTITGLDGTFTTLSLPTVTTDAPTSVSTTSAILGGNVTAAGSSAVTDRGIVYSLTTNPTVANTKVANGTGTGTYSATVSGLISGTLYYVKAYAINGGGPSYGAEQTFTTSTSTLTAGSTFPAGLSTTYGVVSASTSITASGTGLTAGITATPSSTANFEVSSDNTTFGPTATISGTGTVSGTIYVRLKATAPANAAITGNVTLSSTGSNSPVVTIPSSSVTKAVLTYTSDAKSKIYGAAIPALTGTVSGFVNSETIGSATTGTLSFTTTATAGSAVGSFAINGTGLTAANYSFVQDAGNATALTITQRPLTVTANTGQSKTYGNVDPVLTYTVGGAGLYSTDTFSGLLSRAAGENVANYAITQGTLTAGSNYNITFTPGVTFGINQRPVTVTANAGQTKTYGNVDPTLTYTVGGSGLAFAETFSGSLSRAAGENVANYAITQGTLAINSNYNVTFTPGVTFAINQRAVTVTANAGQSKTYGNVDPTLTYTVGGSGLAFADTFSGSLSRAAGENVANYAITQGTLALNANYSLTFTPGVTFAINQRAVTITANAGQSKTYGNVNPTLTFSITAGTLAFADTFSGSLSRAAGENVNNYAITQGTLALNANYAITFTPGVTFAITQRAVTVTANAGQTKTYGNVDPALTYSLTAGSLAFADTFSGSLSRVAGENVNTYAITQGTLALGSNYNVTFTPGVTFAITQRAVTVTANAGQSKIYGNVDPTLTYTVGGSGLAFADTFSGSLDRAAGENVANYAITLGTLSGGSNYNLTFVPGATFAITQRPVTVTANAGQSKIYGNVDPTLTYSVGGSGLAFADTFSGSLSRAAGENVNNYAITQGTLAASSNYNLTFTAGVTFAITKRAVTVTANAGQSKIYGNVDPTLTYTVGGSGLAFADTFSGSLSRAAGENVANYAITIGSLIASSNYNVTFTPGITFAINQRAVTVTANTGQSKIYGNVDPTLTYSVGGSGLAFADTFSGSLSRAAGENAANYAITQGTLALNGNYNITFTPGITFAITQRAVTVTANAGQSKIYGNVDPTLTYTVGGSGLAFADTFSGSLSRAAGENVANYAITQGTLAAGSNYNLTFTPGVTFAINPRSVTVTANAGQSKIYGNVDPTLTYTVGGSGLAFSDTFSGSLSRAAGENVASYAITQGTLAASANYNLTFTPGVTFTITKRAVTVTANAGQSKTYGNVDPTLTYTVGGSGLAFADTFSGSLSRAAGENISNYAITQGTLAANANYTLTFTPGSTFAITQRSVTVTANAGQSKIYGNVDPTLTYTVGGSGLAFADTFSGSLSRAAGENVANYAITQGTLALNGNYNLTFTPGITFAISQRSVTVTANAGQSKIYGNVDPTLTYTVGGSGLAFADTFSGSLSRAAGENVANYAITQGTLAASANYNLTFTPGVTFAIAQKTLTVTASGINKAYDGTTAATVNLSDNRVTGDVFTLTYAAASFTTATVGTNKPVSVTGIAITGGASGNYTLGNTTAATTADITARAIVVTADAKSKIYGDADPALTYTYTGTLVGTDAFSGSLTRAAGANIGAYAINQGTLALSNASNYSLTYNSANLTITPKTLTVTATGINKIYDGATSATVNLSDNRVAGDVFTENYASAAFATATVGTNKPVNVTGINITGGASANYILGNTTAATTADITARAIAVTAAAKSKTYGDADPALTYTFVGTLIGTDNFTGSLSRAVGESVGTYSINQGTLALSANYSITYTGANLTIGAKAVTVTAAAKSKTYGDVDPALTYTVAPALVTGDTFIGSLTRTVGENIGNYAITQGTLALNSNYTLTYAGDNLSIVKKTVTVTAAAKTKTYGDADPALTYTFAPALVTGDTFTGSLTRAVGETVGNYAINQGTLALNANYTLTYVGDNLTIGAKTITVTAAAKTKTYGDADPALTYAFAPALVTGDSFTGSLTRLAGENVGAYVINQGTLALNANYSITYIGANLTIGAKALTVTATAKTKTYGDADPALTYTFAPALVTGDTFSGSLTRAAGENVGTYAINQGTLTAGANYAITYVGANLAIGAKTITVTAAAKTKTYGDADPALTYTFAPALVTGDTFSGSLTRAAGENVGNYGINQGTLTLGTNYAITFVTNNLTIGAKTITLTAAAKSKTYGDVDPALTYTFAPALVTGDTFTGSLTRVVGENIGNYAITQGTVALNANYTLNYVGANLTVGAKTITVTAAAKSKTYGDVDPALTYTFAPALVTGDTFTGSLTRAVGENIGNYAITQGTVALSPNYTLVYVGDNLTIGKKTVTVTASAKTKTYGDADPALTYTFAPALVTGDTFTGSLTRAAGENIGNYAITQGTVALNPNYTLVYVGDNLTIGKKTVTVTAAAKSKTYGDADPALTYTFAPALVTGDTFTGSLTRAAGENVGNYAITQGTIALSANYTLTYVGDNLTIGKKTVTVTAAAKTKTYGDADPALTYTFAPALVTGDTFTGSLTRTVGENVGNYAITQGTVALSPNYTLVYVGDNLTIGKKTVTVTAAAKAKTYGDVDPALTYTFAPALVTGDTFSGSLTRAVGETVGAYAIGQGTLALNSNYTLTYVGDNLTIGKKTVTVTAAAKTKTYGDVDPALTYTFAPALVTGDTFTGSLTRAAGENIGNYAINQGTVALNANYTLVYVGDNLTIGKKTVTVTAAAKTKTYGDVDPALTYTFAPALVTGDTFTGSLTRAAGENIGNYAITQGTVALNANYTLTYVGDNLTIGAKTITVTAAAKSKTYGDADPALTYTFAPALVTGDTFTGGLTRTVGENVGNYAITQGTVALSPNYTLVYVGDNLTIGKKTITVTAAAKSKTYGDVDPALTYTFAPALVTGDTFTGSLTRAVGENIGNYAINQGTLALSANYTLTYVGNNLTIGKKTVTVTAAAKTKSYGDVDPALTYTFAPALVTGDTFTGSLTRAAGENIGNYAINQGTVALNANYTLVYVGDNLTIGKKTVTVTAAAKTKTYGDVDPALTYTFAPALVTGDTFTGSLTRVAGETVGNYAIGQGTVALNANYTLNYVGANLTVGAKTITVTAAAKGKTYGDVDPALTYTFAPALVTGDTFTGSLTRAAGENAGTYAINQGTVALNGNYAITYVGANLTINKAILTVTASNAIMCQADGFPTFAVTYTGFRVGDTENSLTTKPTVSTTANRNTAGTYSLVPANGVASNYSFVYVNGTLTINLLPTANIVSNKGTEISKGETAILTATGGTSYSWSTASGIISGQNTAILTVRPAQTTTYTVRVTNASGCSSVATITIKVNEDYKVVANNILTPNGDGVNDTWFIQNIDMYPSNEVRVFDRNGRLMYNKKGYDNSWNGTIGGNELAEGTYYYIITYGPDKLVQKGFITIIRNR